MGTIVGWIGLVVALLALGYAWKLSQELATATRRLDRYNKALFDANDAMRTQREAFAAEIAQLRIDVRKAQGNAAFTPETTVREALLIHPQSEQVLASFHLGGCSHCAVEPDNTLAQACAEHGVDPNALLGTLNLLVGGHANGQSPTLVKLPNVALELE